MLRTTTSKQVARGVTRSIRTVYTSVLEQDINITKNGKVNISVGPGGRSSRNGYVATVFGATGFLGRYVTSKLARHGTITMVPFRDAEKKKFLKVTGDLGVVNFVEIDARNLQSIQDSVAHSDIVINCIGTDYSTKNFSMADINIGLAERITQAVKDANVPRYIHVSSYNANPRSESVFYATKGIGEEVVRNVLPSTTIVRPSQMYGREDRLLNYLGPKIKMWTPNRNAKLIRPVHVLDVAKAIEHIAFDDSTAGQTYELYGPQELSYREIRQMIHGITEDYTQAGPIPYEFGDYELPLPFLKFIADLKWKYTYFKTTNSDQIQRHLIDQVVDPNAKTFKDLGLKDEDLTVLADVLFTYAKDWRHPLIAQRGAPSSKEIERLREIEHFTH
ncbi:EFM5 [[Candida] subhashii]|uniref:EFM5 n=1 Tax=[Candida] subhashii TaxID=561895 RepID=A0A8J5QI40_9ASCO|nr:EFM5 [[Candida] subhashii]KAG7661556.1 EFM5 [[Candida] subhashii]